MQTSQSNQAAPAAAAAPTPAATTAAPVVVTLPAAPATLLTARDVAAIRERRRELSNQLTSADNRRHRLAKELVDLPVGPTRSGLEQRIGVLDTRIVQIESDIAETGRQLTGAAAGQVASADGPWPLGLTARNVTTIANIFIIFVLAPLAVSAARMMWKRGNRIPMTPAASDNMRKLDQLQQAVDTIAIEVERVSEGQRFVTKLLSETQRVGMPLAAGTPAHAEPEHQTRLG